MHVVGIGFLGLLLSGLAQPPEPLGPGSHLRSVTVGEVERSFRVHVPPQYDAARPMPVVVCFHGAVTSGPIIALYTGLDKKADEAGFIVAYPNGTGSNKLLLTWNSGGIPSAVPEAKRDDVGFTRAMLDDLERVLNVDKRRIFATGISNGGMMSHRLAVELPDRIAAVASVAGALALPNPKPQRRVPVLEIHGDEDRLVPWNGLSLGEFKFRGVDKTIEFWVHHNHATAKATVEKLPDLTEDGTTSTRYTYAAGETGAEVVLVKISGGGHTWPGSKINVQFLGRTPQDFAANDLIWEFFERHPLP